jgi:hypothetical protein
LADLVINALILAKFKNDVIELPKKSIFENKLAFAQAILQRKARTKTDLIRARY